MVGLLAALDAFLVVIPTDGLLIGAVMLAPKRWVYSAVMVSLGSSLGALSLAAILEIHGMPFLLAIKPGIDQTPFFLWTNNLMDNWGGLALFLVALSPMMQHPAIALAALAGMPLLEIFGLVLLGRSIKYGLFAWIASHAPRLLNRIWGLKSELEAAPLPKVKNIST